MQTTKDILIEFEIDIIRFILNSVKKDEITKEDIILFLEKIIKERSIELNSK